MRVAGAVFLASIAAGLLVVGSLFFALYGYCEDACSGPDRTFWGAVGVAWPFAFVAVACITIAVALVMRESRVLPAAGVAILAAAAFVAALAGLVALLSAFADTTGSGPILLLVIALTGAWDAAVVLIAARLG
jgi:hypothetical protein